MRDGAAWGLKMEGPASARPSKSTSVLIIGGGPAGSASAALLARAGVDVALLERDYFPRYHVGESLLPSISPLLQVIGAWDDVAEAGFQVKEGARIFWGGEEWEFNWRGGKLPAFQVDRSRFDEILLRNAAGCGAAVHEGCTVRAVQFDGGRPVAVDWSMDGGATGHTQFDLLIDASGQSGLMATRYLHSRQFMDALRNVAVWGYWKGHRLPRTKLNGPIFIESLPRGWLWGIPLAGNRLSVGLVLHRDALRRRWAKRGIEQLYESALADSAHINKMLTTASLKGPVRTQIDYSYLSERLAGPGFYLVGDSAGFIDPLLSSGVHLALCSALAASATVATVLSSELDEETGVAFYNRAYRGNFLRWVLLVSALYQANGAKDSLFWTAQELSAQDLAAFYGQEPNVVLSMAVSGVPDVEALQSSSLMRAQLRTGILTYRRGLLSEFVDHASGRSGGMDMLRKFDSAGLSSDHPVGGLYVSLSPSLGLRQAHLVESVGLQGTKLGSTGQAPRRHETSG